MRAAATMRELARRSGTSNPHQFAGHFDAITNMETQASGKWRQCFSGDKALSAQQLRLLSFVDANVAKLHDAGPCGLWHALWGDEQALWQLCRTRLDSDGPMTDDRIWSAIVDEFTEERDFGSTLAEFEAEMLLAEAYGRPLTLRHLTEAVALCRLHQALRSLAVLNIDGRGIVRCLRVCLADTSVLSELARLGVLDGVREELADVIDSAEADLPALDRWDALASKVNWIC